VTDFEALGATAAAAGPTSPRSKAVAAVAHGIRRARGSRLARNSALAFAGQGARLVLQALYFVLVARSLGPASYGTFVAVLAFVSIVTPFASWGAGDILIRRVSRDAGLLRQAWGEAIMTAFGLGALFGVAVVLAAPHVFDGRISPLLVGAIAAAEFWGTSLASIAAQAYQAVERLGRMAQVWLAMSVLRVAAAVVLASVKVLQTPMSWALLYLGSTLAAACVIVVWVSRELGRPIFSVAARDRGDIKRGFFYSLSTVALSIYNDIDKTMLARLATFAAAGLYGAGYRIVEVCFVPVAALLQSSYPRFFRHGKEGVRANVALARRMLPAAIVYGVVAGAVLFAAAPLLELVLGAKYASTVLVVRGLAAVPALRAIHYFAANVLTGADRQSSRSAVQVGVAALNVGLNLWLIPRNGWRGAVWATLASEAALAVFLWAVAAVYVMRERNALSAVGGQMSVGAQPNRA
jgi:O-antigen/teichoic acid export membrane protein